MPKFKRTDRAKTIVECPREKKKPTLKRPLAFGHQLPGRVVDRRDVVGIEGVAHPEGEGEDPGAEPEDLAGPRSVVVGTAAPSIRKPSTKRVIIVAAVPATGSGLTRASSASRMVRRTYAPGFFFAIGSPPFPKTFSPEFRPLLTGRRGSRDASDRVILCPCRASRREEPRHPFPTQSNRLLDLFHGSRRPDRDDVTPAPSPLSVRWHLPSHAAEDWPPKFKSLAPDVNLSTVYRNLEELERLGLIVHAHLGHGPAIYHLASEMHGHLVCEACGCRSRRRKVSSTSSGELLGREYGFTIDPRQLRGARTLCKLRCGTRDAARNSPRAAGFFLPKTGPHEQNVSCEHVLARGPGGGRQGSHACGSHRRPKQTRKAIATRPRSIRDD